MATIDVVTGFLGAGKTTFILEYAKFLRAQNIRFCVIENEFGQAGIDGSILQNDRVRVKEISGGCVCCTLKVGMHDMLLSLADEVDRIIIEPSGLFCGDDFLDIVTSPEIAATCELGMWLGIFDPSSIDRLNHEDISVLASELIFCGDLLLSKTQHHDRTTILRAVHFLQSLYPESAPPVHVDPWSAEAMSQLLPTLLRTPAVIRSHERKRFDHSAMFQSAAMSFSLDCSESELLHRLEQMMADETIIRIKGHIVATDQPYLVNASPGCIKLEKTNLSGRPTVNIIGRNLNRAQIKSFLLGAGTEGGSH